MNRKVLIAVAVTILLIGGGVVWWMDSQHRAAERRDTLLLYGNVDIRDVNVGFRVTGRLADLSVDEGAVVKPGDVLGHLDAEPYRRELQEAQASLVSARARLDLSRVGSRAEDVAQAVAQVEQAAAALSSAQRNYERQQQLRGSGAVSQRQYDDALSQRDQAAATLKGMREALRKSRNGNRTQEIEQARADADRATATVAQVQLKLDDAVLHAPSAGTIMTRAVEPGAILAAGVTVFSISLTDPVWVRAYVAETDLGRARPGAVVSVSTDSAPGRHYSGTIGYVSPTAEFTPKSVETTDLRTDLVYRLRIVVDDPDASLRQGMPVTVEVRFTEARPAKTAVDRSSAVDADG